MKMCLLLLVGDDIDNVPRLMTPAKVKAGLKKFGSLKKWLAKDKEFYKTMKAQAKALNLNRKLVAMRLDLPVKSKLSGVDWCSDLEEMPQSYVNYYEFCNPRTHSLFG